VYRGDDGGQTWRANYFQDSRFQSYNVVLHGETASCGKCFKGGETPFGEAICNADPNRVIPVRNEPHITQDGGATWFGGHAYPVPGQKPGPRSVKACNGLVVTTTWHFYIDPFLMMRKSDNDATAGALDTGAPWMRA